jgi:hypothetical protein
VHLLQVVDLVQLPQRVHLLQVLLPQQVLLLVQPPQQELLLQVPPLVQLPQQ